MQLDLKLNPVSTARPRTWYQPKDLSTPPVVTVVTPYFNTGQVFEETVSSMIGQSLVAWEWLIVNDGSTDPQALAVLDQFRDGDRRIRVIDQSQNLGHCVARNIGYREATSDLVLQLDSDDLLEPTALEKMAWFLHTRPQFDFVKGYTVGFGAESYIWRNGFHLGEAFLESNHAEVTAMVRRAVHNKVGGYDETNRMGLEDWDFWLRCAAAGFWGDTIHEPLSWYRRRVDHGSRWQNWDGGARETAFRGVLRSRYPHLWEGGFPHPRAESKASGLGPIESTLPFANPMSKERPRLLLLLPFLELGGAEQVGLDMIDRLIKQGWEATVATTVPSDHRWSDVFLGKTPDVFMTDRFVARADQPRFLRYLIESRRPDVVVINNSRLGYELLPYLRTFGSDTAFVDLCHAEQEDWLSGGYPNLSSLFQEHLDLTIAGSDRLTTWLEAHRSTGAPIVTSHYGVDTNKWKPDPDARAAIRKELGIGASTTVLIYAGRLAAEKRPGMMVEIHRLLRDRYLEVVTILVGDGPLADSVADAAAHLHEPERVIMTGHVDHQRIPALVAAADVLVLPSTREGIALILLEAMSTELTVVAADVGAHSEVVSPGSGLLLEPGLQAEEWAKVIAALVSDSSLRRQMGTAARRRVIEGGFGMEAATGRIETALAAAISVASTPGRRLPTAVEGHRAAVYAVEQHRQDHPAYGTVPADPPDEKTSFVYRAAVRLLGRPYRFLKRRQISWLPRLRFRVRRLLGMKSHTHVN